MCRFHGYRPRTEREGETIDQIQIKKQICLQAEAPVAGMYGRSSPFLCRSRDAGILQYRVYSPDRRSLCNTRLSVEHKHTLEMLDWPMKLFSVLQVLLELKARGSHDKVPPAVGTAANLS